MNIQLSNFLHFVLNAQEVPIAMAQDLWKVERQNGWASSHGLLALLQSRTKACYSSGPESTPFDCSALEANQVQYKTAERNLNDLKDLANVKASIVKGYLTSAHLYPNRAERKLSDLDILADRKAAAEIFDVCRRADYVPNFGDEQQASEEPENLRASMARQLLFSHEYPELSKPGRAKLDINFRVTYPGCEAYREMFNSDEVESDFFSIFYSSGTTLGKELPRHIHFLYLLLHYSAEIILHEFEERATTQDFRLFKVLDLALFIHMEQFDIRDFEETCCQPSFERHFEHIAYVLENVFRTDEISSFFRRIGIKANPDMNIYFKTNGELVQWDVDPYNRAYQ